MFFFPQSDPSSVPQLAWQFVPVQKTLNPVLAFCKGDTVHFLLVSAQLSLYFQKAKYTLERHFVYSISSEEDQIEMTLNIS